MKDKLIIITGASASGKTEYAIKLAKKHNKCVISADSRQVYKNLDYSTNKVQKNDGLEFEKKENRWVIEGINYWGYDLVNPNAVFSAFDFREFALKIIKENKNNLPIICGGTGAYIRALIDKDFVQSPTLFNIEQKNKLENQGYEKLLKKLKQKGYKIEELNESERKNTRRLVRKLEIIEADELCKITKSAETLEFNYDYKIIKRPEPKLEKGILKKWVENNFEKIEYEVRWLMQDYPNSQILEGFIFKEIKEYIKGSLKKEEAKRLIEIRYKNYIKRQMLYQNKYL